MVSYNAITLVPSDAASIVSTRPLAGDYVYNRQMIHSGHSFAVFSTESIWKRASIAENSKPCFGLSDAQTVSF